MKKSDLKVGYVVEYRNGWRRMVMETSSGLIFVRPQGDERGEYGYMLLNDANDDLTDNLGGHGFDIVKVYGFSDTWTTALKVSTKDRQLLWERKEPKKMTVKEISEALGYEVEVIPGE